MAWPERVLGPKQKPSVRDPCREHENGEYCHSYRADGSDVDASGERYKHGALTALFRCFPPRTAWLAISVRRRPVPIGAIPSYRDDAGEADAQYVIPIARQRASISESFGAHASGLPRFSGRTLVSSPSELGCAEPCVGHSNNDFESMSLPSFFVRQSDAKTNSRPDLMASRHCIFASAAQLVF
jgi:hypothetical protein